MPRGRKRAAAQLEDVKSETAEEEVVVDVVDPGDTPVAPPAEQDVLVEATDQPALDQPPPEEAVSTEATPSSRPTKQRRRLPPPRLVNPDMVLTDIRPKKSRAAGGARTRAQSVHESSLDQMKAPKQESELDGEQAETVEHKCDHCGSILYSQIELQEHHRGFHKDVVKGEDLPSGTLLCAHPHCFASFPSVSYLIAHLVAFHSQQQFRIQKKTFDDLDKFCNWKNEAERNARAKFMGMMEPEETATDAFEVTHYCEFCYDWREQDEKGPPIAEQVPRKIIGCPAYFTATIDNKKKKASVIGCFAHLGHHKKVSYTTLPTEKSGGTQGASAAGNLANIKCNYCDMLFRSRSAATRHHRMVHKIIHDEMGVPKGFGIAEPKMPSLECSDPDCTVLCDSMITLVQHVAEVHKADVQVNDFQFPTLEKFETWKTEMEQTTCSKFCKVSGRVLPNEITKYFLCHLSGHTNRTKKKDFTPSDRQRNRPTKKLGRFCTAFMSFKQNKADGTINVRGCLRHFGHPLDVRRLPLPEQVRKEVSDLLLKGSIEDEVVHQIRSQYPENERGHWIQRYEVRNIALKLQREGLMIASKTFLSADEDGHMWDEMGFPEDMQPQYMQGLLPVRATAKLVQYRPIHARSIPITDMHPDRPTHSRYMTRPKEEQIEVVQYVEAEEYTDEEGELIAVDDGDTVYYEQEIEDGEIQTDDGTRVIPIQPHVVEHVMAEELPQHSQGGRKRMPLLKEPMRTGNPAFDDVMMKMKNRFNKISQQLKNTQDVRLAHGMLKELKDLQQRMGVGHNEVMVEPGYEEYYLDEEEEEYALDAEGAVVHEEEVQDHDGYEEFIDEEENVVVEDV